MITIIAILEAGFIFLSMMALAVIQTENKYLNKEIKRLEAELEGEKDE